MKRHGGNRSKARVPQRFFGEVALERGLVEVEDLIDALKTQAETQRRGKPRKRVGRILLENGDISSLGVREVLRELFSTDAADG